MLLVTLVASRVSCSQILPVIYETDIYGNIHVTTSLQQSADCERSSRVLIPFLNPNCVSPSRSSHFLYYSGINNTEDSFKSVGCEAYHTVVIAPGDIWFLRKCYECRLRPIVRYPFRAIDLVKSVRNFS